MGMRAKKLLHIGKMLFVILGVLLLVGCSRISSGNSMYSLNLFYDPAEDATFVIANGDLLNDTVPGEVQICGESIAHDRFLIGRPYNVNPLYLFDRGELYCITEDATQCGLSSEGTKVYYCDSKGTLFLYDVASKTHEQIVKGEPYLADVVLSPNGTHLLYKANAETKMQLYKGSEFICEWHTFMYGLSVSDDASVIYARNEECNVVYHCTTNGRSTNDTEYLRTQRAFCRTAVYKNRDHTELVTADGGLLFYVKDGDLMLLATMEQFYEPEYLFYAPATDWVEINESPYPAILRVATCDIDTFVDSVIDRTNLAIAIRRSSNDDPYVSDYEGEEAVISDNIFHFRQQHLIYFLKNGVLYKQKLQRNKTASTGETDLCDPQYSKPVATDVSYWKVIGDDIYYLTYYGGLYRTGPTAIAPVRLLKNVCSFSLAHGSKLLCLTSRKDKDDLYLVGRWRKTKLSIREFPELSGAEEAFRKMRYKNLVYEVETPAGGTNTYRIANGKVHCFLKAAPQWDDPVVWTEWSPNSIAEPEPEKETPEKPAETVSEEISLEASNDIWWDGPTRTITGQVYQTRYWRMDDSKNPDLKPLPGAKVEYHCSNMLLARTYTDEEGRYQLNVPFEKASFTVSIAKNGYSSTTIWSEKGSEKTYDNGRSVLYNYAEGFGACGENVKWNIDENGELILNGQGAAVLNEKNTWEPEAVRSVIVDEGITSLGENLFENCKNMETVTLPNTLEKIERAAFWNCKSLKEVILPDSVTTLGVYVFCKCESLERLTLGKGVTYLDDKALSGTTALTELIWPVSLVDFHDKAFYNTHLNRIYYAGTEEQWEKVKKTNDLADVNVFFGTDTFREPIQSSNADTPIALHAGMSEKEQAQLVQGSVVTIGTWRAKSQYDLSDGQKTAPIQWIVLENSDGKLLLLSRYALYFSALMDITHWYGTLSDAFTRQEHEVLQYPPSKAGSLNEADKFFLLSVEDFHKYYDLAEVRTCSRTAYIDGLVEYEIDHHNPLFDENAWWLDWDHDESQINPRSHFVTETGTIDIGNDVYMFLVRPAVWVDIS